MSITSYRNVVSAVVRALAAETINSAGGCDFDPKVQSGAQSGAITGKEAKFLADCWVFGRLHKNLTKGQWLALVAKFSTHTERKHAAIEWLMRSVQSPAPERFRHAATLTWALPKPAGIQGKRSTSVLPAAWYNMDNWTDEPTPARTQYRWKSSICGDLEAAVSRALMAAQEMLDAEGLIVAEAA